MTTIRRGTLYLGSGFAYRRIEARGIRIETGRHAQFAGALMVTFTRKGARKPVRMHLTDSRMVILEGWGHPTPPPAYGDGQALPTTQTEFGEISATIHASRMTVGDPRWDREFDQRLADYLAESGARIAADYRDHDFMDDFGPRLSVAELSPDMPVTVLGVKDGEIVPVESWELGEFGRICPGQEFANLAEAKRVFPDLDLAQPGRRFVGPAVTKSRRGQFSSTFRTLDADAY